MIFIEREEACNPEGNTKTTKQIESSVPSPSLPSPRKSLFTEISQKIELMRSIDEDGGSSCGPIYICLITGTLIQILRFSNQDKSDSCVTDVRYCKSVLIPI